MLAQAVRDDDDLSAILRLQQKNLPAVLTREEARREGFVTVQHSLEILKKMHAIAPSVIVRDGADLAGYALMLPPACRDLLPVILTMFEAFGALSWRNRPLPEHRYYVMGQICVAREHRGRGVFEALYRGHAELYGPHHDLVVTEISVNNERSARAHRKLGFVEIGRHRDSADDWSIVGWDFRRISRPARG
jgi:ribosomal protein S18 acetylase RimI-like enzyme